MPDDIKETNLTIEILVKQVEPFIEEHGKDGIIKFNEAKRKFYIGLLNDPKANHHDGLLKHMIKPENINSHRLKYILESYVSDRKDGLLIDREIESFCLERLDEIAKDINPKQSLGIKDKTGPKQDFVMDFQMICYLNYLLKTGIKPTKAKEITIEKFLSNLKTLNRVSKEIKIPDVSTETLLILATAATKNISYFFSMAD